MNGAYYLWARKQVDVEVASDFELLRSLQTPLTSPFLSIMELLPQSSKGATWKSLLKRFHAEGSKVVGDPPTNEDRRVIQQYDEMRRSLIATHEPDISPSNIATAATLQEAARGVLQHMFQAPPKKCGKNLLRFVSNCKHGVIHTYLDAGSSNYQLCYWHDVFAASGQVVRERCSVLEWLGISSQTLWDETPDAKIQPVVASLGNAVTGFTEFCEREWSG
jgi:hypothetical protein